MNKRIFRTTQGDVIEVAVTEEGPCRHKTIKNIQTFDRESIFIGECDSCGEKFTREQLQEYIKD